MATYYTYEAISKKWLSYVIWKKVPKPFISSFLKQQCLVEGSANAPPDSVWARPHVLFLGTQSQDSVTKLYFLSSDIEELINIIIEKYPELDRQLLVPEKKKLVSHSVFEDISPITFDSVKALNDKRQGIALTRNVDTFRLNKLLVRDYMRDGKGAVLAIDVESWESDHTVILELGWAWLRWDKLPDGNVQEAGDNQHLIITDNIHHHNGRYTPDNQRYYNFGKSRKTSLKKAVAEMQATIEHLRRNKAPLLLVLHNASAEIDYFAGLGINTRDWAATFPVDDAVSEGVSEASDATLAVTQKLCTEGTVYIQDTQLLFAASGHPEARKQIGLENALRAMGIPCRRMHNAGNDAYYTLAIYEALVGDGIIKEELVDQERAFREKQGQKASSYASGWD